MTLIELDASTLHRSEVWPTEKLYGLPVLLSGGEVGLSRSGITPRTTVGGGGPSSSPTTPAVLTTGHHLATGRELGHRPREPADSHGCRSAGCRRGCRR